MVSHGFSLKPSRNLRKLRTGHALSAEGDSEVPRQNHYPPKGDEEISQTNPKMQEDYPKPYL